MFAKYGPVVFGIPLLILGFLWVLAPETAAANLSSELLTGAALTTQIGDSAAFFLGSRCTCQNYRSDGTRRRHDHRRHCGGVVDAGCGLDRGAANQKRSECLGHDDANARCGTLVDCPPL